MAFGLEHEEELEYWMQRGRLAVRVHEAGHCLMETTKLCAILYATMTEKDFTEEEVAKEVHAYQEKGLDHRSAFGVAILKMAREHEIRLSDCSLFAARRGYANRASKR